MPPISYFMLFTNLIWENFTELHYSILKGFLLPIICSTSSNSYLLSLQLLDNYLILHEALLSNSLSYLQLVSSLWPTQSHHKYTKQHKNK